MVKYSQAFDIAKTVRRYRFPHLYRNGVERAAALAAVEQTNLNGVLDAIQDVFYKYEITVNHNWDGSIG